jgi:alpha/beta superfamily hydrolase
MVHQSHSFYLRFFVEKGINVFIWNYRSYGRSKGTPDPASFKNDIKDVYSYLVTQIKVTGKIGVYGRSLGGIPSCYISPNVDMVIIDRSFSNLQDMTRAKYNSAFAEFLFKMGSFGW